MNDFQFKNTTDIRFGKNHIDEELHNTVSKIGKRVLLAYGGGSIKKSGLYDRVIKALGNDIQITELSGIEPNPKIESVRQGQKLVKDNNIEVVLAVGGGSVIDAAKVIASSYYYEGDPWDLVIGKKNRFEIKQLPVVDILTLSATGTEMNQGSVISNPETKQKIGTFGPNTPAVSFLDPELTYSVSEWQTAAGSIDIFSHLVEQYFDRGDTYVIDSMIEGVMRSVIQFAPIALKNPNDYQARGSLMLASTMALNGLFRSGKENSWSVHPIEHELSAYYDITHGVGLGILTPRWMKKVLNDSSKSKFARFAREVWGISGDDENEMAQKAIQATYDWVKSLNVPMTLPGVEITSDENFEAMAESSVRIGNLANAYLPLTKEDVVDLYKQSMTTDGFE